MASFLLPCCYESNLRQIKSCPSFTTQTDTNNLRYYKVYCARQDDRILIFDLITENLLLNSVAHERCEQTFSWKQKWRRAAGPIQITFQEFKYCLYIIRLNKEAASCVVVWFVIDFVKVWIQLKLFKFIVTLLRNLSLCVLGYWYSIKIVINYWRWIKALQDLLITNIQHIFKN